MYIVLHITEDGNKISFKQEEPKAFALYEKIVNEWDEENDLKVSIITMNGDCDIDITYDSNDFLLEGPCDETFVYEGPID
jgi:hypothetical protein